MPGSVTNWLGALREGDEDAAQQLWERYFDKLVRLCRKRLQDHPRRAADEEDVALSAFASLAQGIQAGRFPRLTDRDNLWRLLVVIAVRKTLTLLEAQGRHKRGSGRLRGESAFRVAQDSQGAQGIDQAVGDSPTPALAATMAEEFDRLMQALDDRTLQAIARQKLEGYSNQEIAERLGTTLRTVERRLQSIREIWTPGDAA